MCQWLTISNVAGTVAYAAAGPNTRTTQLFINYGDNSFLDAQGFTPFAKLDGVSMIVSKLTVTLAASMKTAESIFAKYGENPDQGSIYSQGLVSFITV